MEAIQNPPEGFYFYDTENETVDSAPIRYVAPQETLPLSHSNSLNLELSVIQLSDSFYEEPVHWTSSDPEIATVVSYNGTVTGVKSGTTTITATLAYSGYSKSYTLVVTEIPNGTYYLKNIETGCFADMTTSSPNNGTAVYQYNYSDFEIYQNDDELVEVNFDRNSITKWELKRISGVYYTICISNLSTPYYLSVINGSTNVDVGIVVYTGTVGRYMQWKIEPVHETIDNVQYIKGYKIIPAHTSFKDYVLATATSSSTNNIQLIQGDYIADNGYYRDVWYVLKEYDMDFYAIDDGNRSRQQLPYEDSITHIVSFGGYDDLEIVTQSNATDCKADLDSSEYMIIHAHGDIAAYANIIKLDKDDATYLFSYDSTNLSGQSKYLGSNSNEDYSNLKLVLFMNCHSGETDFNFVSRIVDLGAKNAIGFIGKQDTDKAEEWQVTFWESYCAGNNIDICIRIACAASGILYSDVVVEGNVSDTIFKQTATT